MELGGQLLSAQRAFEAQPLLTAAERDRLDADDAAPADVRRVLEQPPVDAGVELERGDGQAFVVAIERSMKREARVAKALRGEGDVELPPVGGEGRVHLFERL